MPETALRFEVETVVLDLPALAGALSRRLHDAGVPDDAGARRRPGAGP